MTNRPRSREQVKRIYWAAATALLIAAPLTVTPATTDLSAESCPANMVYDSVMDLCVPRGMSYDTNFVTPPMCASSGPAICRGPKPRPPAPGGMPVEAPGGHYRAGERYRP